LNYDTEVTIADFTELSGNFGKSSIQPAAAAAEMDAGAATKTSARQMRSRAPGRRQVHHQRRHRSVRHSRIYVLQRQP
jgi:hypothetical protein